MIIELINLFKRIADSHSMIYSFDKGDMFSIDKTGEALHPELYLETTFNINNDLSTKQYKTVSFTYYLSDIPSEGQEDADILLSKIEQINEDITMTLQLKDFIEFSELLSYNSITLKEWNGDNCVAIRTELSFRILRTGNLCLAPIII